MNTIARFLGPLNGYTYAALRIVTGLLFLFHGSQKLLGWPAEPTAGMAPYVTYVGGPIELIGGALVMVGLMTRWAAFICSGEMAFAYWMAHGSGSMYPLLNRGELAIMFCFAFLYIASQGPGIWSLDATRGSR
jgi:putative oxidoreductase